ncbi:glycosyltransferase [Microbacterium sp. CPCC 204701]|uniref:glycosyltransferase n=1 Tax=Microbacterium sp. CPCC 204701 TaxID=2493084 RepID=UPI0013E3FD8C|nr:glycosyltransferase [Microbacterium sp. CPCC 204701]
MRVLLWPIHGGYTDAFVRGDHEYLLPIEAGTDADPSLTAWGWTRTQQVPADRLRDEHIDVVVLQRLEELDECVRLTGRVPGRDVPAVFLEHNTPQPEAVTRSHPLAERTDIPIVHVTHFNQLVWDSGRAATFVVEHGVPDPGPLYSGELERVGVVVNEPVRRGRVVGTDLLPRFGLEAPVDVFGMGGEELRAAFDGTGAVVPAGDLPPERLHRELARRRVYLHPFRWTSLGLSLLEAMHLAMPVVALATTEAVRAVPPGAGVISTNIADLRAAVRAFLADPDWAHEIGRRGREHALAHYGLDPFLARWDDVLSQVAATHPHDRARRTSVAR